MEPTHFESLYPDTSRFNEIEKILGYVKEGNSCQVVSLPGVGRSNLFGLLAYNRNVRIKHLGENQKWFHFVSVNFSEVRKRSLADITKFLFLSLVESLQERKFEEQYQKAQAIFAQSLGLNDELVLFQGLKKTIDLLAIEQELTIVFLFDRFEEYIPTLTPEFFANLRVLRNRAKYRFSVVFSLNRPIEDIIEPNLFSDYYEFLAGHTVYLPLLDTPTLDFRTSYIEKVTGKSLNKDLLKSILTLTAGHGKLTRITVEEVLNTTPPEDLTSFLLAQKSILGACFEIWQSLMPHEQHALLESSKEGIKQQEELTYLENVALIQDGNITIPLFAAFIKNVIHSVNTNSITFDEQTKEIKKGPITLSETLTATEFRLLKFLLQNQNRTIEREEIITAVWKEGKSTAGVTDQAVDQLIFRLRHKIEDDPNNPLHLQTIKGRGFKFAP